MASKGMGKSVNNEGIQARMVRADVLAVGRGAKAVKTEITDSLTRAEVEKALKEMRAGLDGIVKDPARRAAVEKDLRRLEAASAKKKIDRVQAGGILEAITRRLKSVGIVVTEVAALSGPLKKLADLLAVPLKSLGLL